MAAAVSEGAAGWCCGVVRIRAEWAQTCLGVRNTEHGKRSGLMLTVERRGLGRVEVTARQSGRILGIDNFYADGRSQQTASAHKWAICELA